MSNRPPSALPRAKASFVPSGDQAGSTLLPSRVNCRSPLPSGRISQMSQWDLEGTSWLHDPRSNAMDFPSGAHLASLSTLRPLVRRLWSLPFAFITHKAEGREQPMVEQAPWTKTIRRPAADHEGSPLSWLWVSRRSGLPSGFLT